MGTAGGRLSPHFLLRYHVAVHPLAQRVLFHIRRQELLKAGDRVGVAVSGGIDSVALLQLLLELRHELGVVLSVVHFNHKLRGAESDADQEFVANLAREHDLEFHVDSDDVARHAAQEHVSVEVAARDLRYGFFRHLLREDRNGEDRNGGDRGCGDPRGLKPASLLGSDGAAQSRAFSKLDKIATGHTLDDQAETVLMRLIRGAGLRGLGAIYSRIPVEDDDGNACGEIVRPLLAIRRRALEQYLNDLGQSWREDSTNDDAKFTRNRVRKLVIPLLEKEFNAAVAESLAELAEIARGEEDYWENEVAGWMGTAVHWSEPDWARKSSSDAGLVQISPPVSRTVTSSVDVGLQSRIDEAPWLVMNASVGRVWFLAEPIAVQRRLVKAIGEHAGIPLGYKHVEEILRFAAEDAKACKELSLPLGWKVVLLADALLFATPDLREPIPPQDYEYPLAVPGQTAVFEAGSMFETRRISGDARGEYNLDQLLDADSLPGSLTVRNWRAGDRFWPAHSKSPKKIKELLQERHIPQPERKLWPVVVSGDEIVWVRGFSTSARYRGKPGLEAILISEKLFDGESST